METNKIQDEVVVKKQVMFRGHSVEDLKKIDVREFAKFLKSRQRRSALRQFNKIEDFVKRCQKKIENKKPIRTHDRDIIIVPQMVGMKIAIHDGRTFQPVEIIGEMLGHYLGEFSLTRGKVKHGAAGIGSTKGTKTQAK